MSTVARTRWLPWRGAGAAGSRSPGIAAGTRPANPRKPMVLIIDGSLENVAHMYRLLLKIATVVRARLK